MITSRLLDVTTQELVDGDKSYSLDELRGICSVEELEGGCYLCISRPDELLV